MQKIEEVEKNLNAAPSLILEGYVFDQGISLTDFILKFIDTLNITYCTVDSNGFVETQGKHRSLGDIYRICRSYFPSVTLAEVYDILNMLWAEVKIKSLHCYNIRKTVYFEDAHYHVGNRFKPRSGYFRENEYGWILAEPEHYFNYKSTILTHE